MKAKAHVEQCHPFQNETPQNVEEQTQVNKEKAVTAELDKCLLVAQVCLKV